MLAEIAAEVGTPFYAYDADVFRARIDGLKRALAGTPKPRLLLGEGERRSRAAHDRR